MFELFVVKMFQSMLAYFLTLVVAKFKQEIQSLFFFSEVVGGRRHLLRWHLSCFCTFLPFAHLTQNFEPQKQDVTCLPNGDGSRRDIAYICHTRYASPYPKCAIEKCIYIGCFFTGPPPKKYRIGSVDTFRGGPVRKKIPCIIIPLIHHPK